MRSVLALCLLIALCASAGAAKLHHSKSPTAQLRARQNIILPRSQPQTASGRFAVPGWTDDETRSWLDAASANHGD
jgi:hypothetical protein